MALGQTSWGRFADRADPIGCLERRSVAAGVGLDAAGLLCGRM